MLFQRRDKRLDADVTDVATKKTAREDIARKRARGKEAKETTDVIISRCGMDIAAPASITAPASPNLFVFSKDSPRLGSEGEMERERGRERREGHHVMGDHQGGVQGRMKGGRL